MSKNYNRWLTFLRVTEEIVVPSLKQRICNFSKSQGCNNFEELLNKYSHQMFHLRFEKSECCHDKSNCYKLEKPPLLCNDWDRLYRKKESTKCKSKLCFCQYKGNKVDIDDVKLSLIELILTEICSLKSNEITAVKDLIYLQKKYIANNKKTILEEDFPSILSNLFASVEILDSDKLNDMKKIFDEPLEYICQEELDETDQPPVKKRRRQWLACKETANNRSVIMQRRVQRKGRLKRLTININAQNVQIGNENSINFLPDGGETYMQLLKNI